jgi:hypothetical protein
MNQKEQERRAKLMKMQAERLPEIKRRFEENQKRAEIKDNSPTVTGEAVIFEEVQKRHFNSNFKAGGKDAHLVKKKTTKSSTKSAQKATRKPVKNDKKTTKKSPAEARKVDLSVSTKKGDMVHHQRMLSQDVNAQATQHIIGIPVNKSRYNGHDGVQFTNNQLKQAHPDKDSVLIIPIGGTGEFGIGKNMTVIQYKDEAIVIDMGVLFASDDYPGVNYMVPDIKYIEENMDKIKAICFTHALLDHIGACRHILPKFPTTTPVYGSEFTIGMIKKQMSELSEVPDTNYVVVDPFKHEKIAVSEHLSVEFIHTLHSIPGNNAIVVRTQMA